MQTVETDSDCELLGATLRSIETKLTALHKRSPAKSKETKIYDPTSNLDSLAKRLNSLSKRERLEDDETKQTPLEDLHESNSYSAIKKLETLFKRSEDADRRPATEERKEDDSGACDDILSRSKDSHLAKGTDVQGDDTSNKFIIESNQKKSLGLIPSKDLFAYFDQEKKKIVRRAHLDLHRSNNKKTRTMYEQEVKPIIEDNRRSNKRIIDKSYAQLLKDNMLASSLETRNVSPIVNHLHDYKSIIKRPSSGSNFDCMLQKLESLNKSSSMRRLGGLSNISIGKKGRPIMHPLPQSRPQASLQLQVNRLISRRVDINN